MEVCAFFFPILILLLLYTTTSTKFQTTMSSAPRVTGVLPDLPPGFVFCPSYQQMVSMLRSRMVRLTDDDGGLINPWFQRPRFLDVSLFEPEDLPSYKEMYKYHVSFFYTSPAKEVPHGAQLTHLTPQGSWKCTMKENPIKERAGGDLTIGYKRIFIYYQGKTPDEVKTSWVMEEVRMNPHLPHHRHLDEEKMRSMVMCKVYNFLEGRKLGDRQTEYELEEEADGTLG